MSPLRIESSRDDDLVLELLSRWKPASARAFVGNFRSEQLVAWSQAGPVGVLVGTHDFGNWDILEDYQHLGDADRGSYVQAMWVDPQRRGQGVGSALLETFVAQAAGIGSRVVVTFPDEEDRGRIERVRFFERNGFGFLDYPCGVREPWLMGLALD